MLVEKADRHEIRYTYPYVYAPQRIEIWAHNRTQANSSCDAVAGDMVTLHGNPSEFASSILSLMSYCYFSTSNTTYSSENDFHVRRDNLVMNKLIHFTA
jgi:hypothetical protein